MNDNCNYRRFWQYVKEKKGSQKVLLLINDHSAYVAAIENLNASSNSIFSIIEVCFLPPNTTSLYQPYDQGIIASFKVLYRRYWTRYLLQEFEEGRKGRETINVLKAIKWVVNV